MSNQNPLETAIFNERVQFLNNSQYWSKAELEDFQLKKLKELVAYVYEQIPFYRNFLVKNKLNETDFNSLTDIRKFPLIDKDTIRADYDKFIPINYNRSELSHRTTGGSTGSPLTVYADLDFYSRDKANTQHYMQVFDLDIFNYRSIRLYGDKISDELLSKNIFWRVEDSRKLVMSCYHINNATAALYVEKINDFKPNYIHTRPSSIYPLANAIIELGLQIDAQFDYIFCDGEYLTDGQRNIIEKAFDARMINVFGHTEGCLMGHPCKESNALHYLPQVGILELLDKDGNEVKDEGDKGEIVATGFNNRMFPLIRYRTGDIAIQGSQSCKCNRRYRIIKKIEGRMTDYVIDVKKNLIPLAPAVFNYNDLDWKGVKEFKVIQSEIGVLELLIVPEDHMNPGANHLCDYLKNGIQKIFGGTFTVNVTVTNDLPKTKIGKYRYLDQKLEVTDYFRN